MSDDEFTSRGGEKTPVANDGGVSLPNRVFRALAHRRRRYVLYYLREHEQATTDDLAAQLAAWEHHISITEVSPTEAEQVKRSLVHSHLPKLDDFGLVEYDKRSETVSYTSPPGLLDDAIELASTLENPS